MPLPITIPNTFANATTTIPLSQLDNNFSTVAVAVNSIGNSVINYTYQDTNYTDSQTYQYYLVAGNMNSHGSGSGSPGVTVRFPSVTVQEIKR